MKPHRTHLRASLLLSALACRAQVAEEHTARVRLSLEGTMRQAPGAEAGLVPALIFIGFDEEYDDLRGRYTAARVHETVEGSLRSQFRLVFSEPPPEDLLSTNVAQLVLVEPDLPDRWVVPSTTQQLGDCHDSEYTA